MIDLVSKVKKDTEKKYSTYHSFRQNLSRLQSYQVLAIFRGEKEKALKVSFASIRDNLSPTPNSNNDDGISKMLDSTIYKLPKGLYSGKKKVVMPRTAEKLEAWKRARSRLRKLCERMWRRQIKEMADEKAISLFSSNLHQKLLTPPLRYWAETRKVENIQLDDEMRVIALDPGFAHGTKVAVLKASDGSVIDTLTLNMIKSETAVAMLRSVIWKNRNMCISDVIAVGNGHGSQNAMQIVKEAIGMGEKQIKNIIYVDETGASIYSGMYFKYIDV